MGVKLAVVGGGSTYTPELIEGIARRSDRLPVDELVLLDIDAERLDDRRRARRADAPRLGWPGRLVLTGRPDAAIDGADFVLIQLRVGGQAARLVDETLPPKFGTIGQETTGAGGFAKALRTVPVVLDLAERTAKRAARRARGSSTSRTRSGSSPRRCSTRAIARSGCATSRSASSASSRSATASSRSGSSSSTSGLNHLSWERAVRVDGVDRLPEILADGGAEAIAGGSVAGRDRPAAGRDPVATTSSTTTRSTRCSRTSRTAPSRAPTRSSTSRASCSTCTATRTSTRSRSCSSERGGAFYTEAAAQLIASLHDGRGDVQVVDVRNDGARPGPAGRRGRRGPRADRPRRRPPLPTGPLAPEHARARRSRSRRTSGSTITAAISGDRGTRSAALLANPLVPGAEAAQQLRDALIEANLPYLPRFVAAGTVRPLTSW